METKTISFIVGIAVVLFTMYYLEKKMEKRQIFWLYAIIGIALGAASIRTVVKGQNNLEYYLTFAVLAILIAILYHDYETKEEKEPPQEETKDRKKSKKRKRKGR